MSKRTATRSADELVASLTESRDERRARRTAPQATDAHPTYDDAVIIRQSAQRALEGDSSLTEFTKMAEMTLDRGDVRDLPGAMSIRAIATDLVRNTARGRELRKQYNAVPLIDRSNAKTVVGHLIVIEGTAYILAVYSAAKTIETVTDDDLVIIDNAFSVAIAQIVERHKVKNLHIGPFHRLVRHKKAAERLETALLRNGTVIHTDTGPIAMATEAGRDAYTLNALIGEKQYIGTVQSLTNGQHALLEKGQWNKAAGQLPAAGYKLRDEERDPTPVPDPTKIGMIRDLITWAADPKITTAEIAKRLGAEHGYVSGVAQSRAKGKQITIDELRHPETAVINLLRKGLPLWLTGRYAMKIGIPAHLANEKLRTGAQERVRTIDGTRRRMATFDIDFHHEELPDGQWADPKLIRKALEVRFGSKTAAPTGRAASAQGERKPLSGIGEWIAGDTQYALSARDSSNYLVKSRPVTDATDPDTGARRGWTDKERGLVATISPAELHQALADAIIEHLDGETGLAWRRTGTVGIGATAAAVDAANIDELHEALRTIEAEIDDAEYDYSLARKERLEETARERMRTLEDARRRQRELQDRITAAETAKLEQRVLTTGAKTDAAHIAATLAALASTEDRAPAKLNDLLRHLIVDLTATPNRDGITVNVGCSIRVTTTDGSIILGPITTTVTNQARAIADARKTTLAGYVFRDGMTIEEAAAAAGFSDVAYARRRLHVELEKSGIIPVAELRAAAIACPIPETKRVIWAAHTAAIEGKAAKVPAGIDPAFAAHIIATYSNPDGRWVRHWCNGEHATPRAAAAAAKTAGKAGMAWDAILELIAPDASPDQLRLISEELTAGKGTHNGGRNTIAYDPVLKRSEPWHRHAKRRVWARECPYCGTQTLTHVIRTPEVPGGMICTKCRHTPSLPTVKYPAGYMDDHAGHRDAR